MKLTILLLTIASLLITFSVNLKQDFSFLLDKVETSMKVNKPNWKLTEKEVTSKSGRYEWKLDKQYVTASIYPTRSEEDAIELLKQTMRRVPVGPKSKLSELGDEAYLYKSDGHEGSMILIRKANTFIQINSSRLEHAEAFAKDINTLIQSKEEI